MSILIEDPDRARRLARAIASDIALYNAPKLAAGTDLTAEIEEGRTLFQTRVVASLGPLFDDAVAAMCKSPSGAPAVYTRPVPAEASPYAPSSTSPSADEPRPSPYDHPPVPARPAQLSGRRIAWLIITIVIVALAMVFAASQVHFHRR